MSDSILASAGEMEFSALLKRDDLCLKLGQAVCREHSLSEDCRRISEGSQLVFSSAGRHIIKLFSPRDESFFETEKLFLERLHGRLPILTPRLDASGHFGQYPYIIMEELQGRTLKVVWNELLDPERAGIVGRLGKAVRALHDLPPDLFAGAPFQWEPFIKHQRTNLIANHREFGLDEAWVSQLDEYINSGRIDFQRPARLVPLHTELMREHVIVNQTGGGWDVTGLIDFEPSMAGHREYEFCSFGIFVAPGNRDLFRLFLSSYGYRDEELTPDLSRKIMIYLLHHRYGNIRRFMASAPAEKQFSTLKQLEEYWFGL